MNDLSPQIYEALKFFAFLGFLIFTTLLVGLNKAFFNVVFHKKTFTYWMLFLTFTLIPLIFGLLTFSYFFGDLTLPF